MHVNSDLRPTRVLGSVGGALTAGGVCPHPGRPLQRDSLTSSSLPVCRDQMKISKESWAPAETISPLESTATQENWVGRGDVKVRKFRYLQEGWSRVGIAGRGPDPHVFPGPECWGFTPELLSRARASQLAGSLSLPHSPAQRDNL